MILTVALLRKQSVLILLTKPKQYKLRLLLNRLGESDANTLIDIRGFDEVGYWHSINSKYNLLIVDNQVLKSEWYRLIDSVPQVIVFNPPLERKRSLRLIDTDRVTTINIPYTIYQGYQPDVDIERIALELDHGFHRCDAVIRSLRSRVEGDDRMEMVTVYHQWLTNEEKRYLKKELTRCVFNFVKYGSEARPPETKIAVYLDSESIQHIKLYRALVGFRGFNRNLIPHKTLLITYRDRLRLDHRLFSYELYERYGIEMRLDRPWCYDRMRIRLNQLKIDPSSITNAIDFHLLYDPKRTELNRYREIFSSVNSFEQLSS